MFECTTVEWTKMLSRLEGCVYLVKVKVAGRCRRPADLFLFQRESYSITQIACTCAHLHTYSLICYSLIFAKQVLYPLCWLPAYLSHASLPVCLQKIALLIFFKCNLLILSLLHRVDLSTLFEKIYLYTYTTFFCSCSSN